jgi:hypothetical protein
MNADTDFEHEGHGEHRVGSDFLATKEHKDHKEIRFILVGPVALNGRLGAAAPT